MIKIPINLDNLKNIDFKNPRTQVIIAASVICAAIIILSVYFVLIPQISRDVQLIGKALKMKTDIRIAKSMTAENTSRPHKYVGSESPIPPADRNN